MISAKLSKTLLCLLLLIFSAQTWSAVYKCENAYSEVIFSDEPCADGGKGTEIKWLPKKYKQTGTKKKQPAKTVSENDDEAYTIVKLLTSSRIRLLTASINSSRGTHINENNELVLPDGITIDFLQVKKITVNQFFGNEDALSVKILMRDGNQDIIMIAKPYPMINGRTKIGKFSKSLADIKSMEFYNSKKLKPIDLSAQDRTVKEAAKTPVIELDLTPAPGLVTPLNRPLQIQPSGNDDGGSGQSAAVPRIKTLPVKRLSTSATYPEKIKNKSQMMKTQANDVEFLLTNEKRIFLIEKSLGSSRDNDSYIAGQLLLKDNVKIPFNEMKAIKVKPTGDGKAIVLAVTLLTGEIKMENMSLPFTRISGKTQSADFSVSLKDINTVRFPR